MAIMDGEETEDDQESTTDVRGSKRFFARGYSFFKRRTGRWFHTPCPALTSPGRADRRSRGGPRLPSG